MWSYLTRSFINPPPAYVENKARDADTLQVSTKLPLWSHVLIDAVSFARTSSRGVVDASDSRRDKTHSGSPSLATVASVGEVAGDFFRIAAPTRLL
jgi:hypothetical protein